MIKETSEGIHNGMKEYEVNKVYRLLEPGPVIMVATKDKKGVPNVMTCGFQMVVQHEPSLISIILGPWDHIFQNINASGECVIAIPGVDMIEKVVDIGNCSGEDEDKFQKFGLT